MANAGVPPQGWDNSGVARLQSVWDAATQGAGLSNSGEYDPKDISYYEDRGIVQRDPQGNPLLDPQGNPITVSYATPQAPAPLLEIPTSSINAARPRTVAAGYDSTRGVMTVMFRDGTVYNYYDVSPSEWLTFHGSLSKGRAGLNKYRNGVYSPGTFIGKPQGPADLSNADPAVINQIYTIAANAQVRFVTNRNYAVPNAGMSLESAQKARKKGSTSVIGKRVSRGALRKAGMGAAVNPNANNGTNKTRRKP